MCINYDRINNFIVRQKKHGLGYFPNAVNVQGTNVGIVVTKKEIVSIFCNLKDWIIKKNVQGVVKQRSRRGSMMQMPF